MFLVIRMRRLMCGGLLCTIAVLCGLLVFRGQGRAFLPVFSGGTDSSVVLVLDAGHGGEDGGAVSTVDSTVSESGPNLAVALRIEDLMALLGQETVMTRREDVSVHSPEATTLRQKKVSDIHNRTALVNDIPNAVLLSIHQNSLPSSPVTHGAQVFWNGGEGAQELAQRVQDALNAAINRGNEKKTKRIPDSIYLMNHITAPGILVECGFLSNREETVRLCQPDYQLRLATAITAGCGALEG